VALTLSYQTQADATAHTDIWYDDPDNDSDHQEAFDGPVEANAAAHLWAWYEEPPMDPEDPIEMSETDVQATARSAIQVGSHDGWAVGISSDIGFEVAVDTMGMDPRSGSGELTGSTQFDGVLQVGTSSRFPAGEPLEILFEAGVTEKEDYWYENKSANWWVKLWRGAELIGVMDPAAPELLLNVVAGEELTLQTHFTADGFASFYSRLTATYDVQFGLAIEVVPEPAALSLLALGSLAVLRRRHATTKPPGEDGRR